MRCGRAPLPPAAAAFRVRSLERCRLCRRIKNPNLSKKAASLLRPIQKAFDGHAADSLCIFAARGGGEHYVGADAKISIEDFLAASYNEGALDPDGVVYLRYAFDRAAAVEAGLPDWTPEMGADVREEELRLRQFAAAAGAMAAGGGAAGGAAAGSAAADAAAAPLVGHAAAAPPREALASAAAVSPTGVAVPAAAAAAVAAAAPAPAPAPAAARQSAGWREAEMRRKVCETWP